VEVDNFTKLKVDVRFFEKLAKTVLTGEKKAHTKLSVSFVSPAEIKKLNKEYRKKDKPTDVLSFTYKDSGEIIICPQIIRENAKKFDVAFKKELVRVLIHGILHILGYDHEQKAQEAVKMEKKTNYYLKLFVK
jgi:probable rRNA maturation factor